MAKVNKAPRRVASSTGRRAVRPGKKTVLRAAAKPAKSASTKAAPRSDRADQVARILRGLAKAYPDAACALRHQSAYQLLVATILSAQCTDVRVNMVTPALFARYPDARALADADQAELEAMIRSTGFFRAKAASLRGMAHAVVERFHGEIPQSLDALVTLPGVGRKTANVVLGTVWGIAAGVVVDTHVKRIATLLGLTKGGSAEQIEQDLMRLVPRSEWVNFSHRLIHHGRSICIARRPKCPQCPLLACCDRVGLPPLT